MRGCKKNCAGDDDDGYKGGRNECDAHDDGDEDLGGDAIAQPMMMASVCKGGGR